MGSDFQDLTIVGVEEKGIQKGPTGHYRYPFKLSATPNREWAEIFEAVPRYRMINSALLPSTLYGNLIVVTMSEDDLEQTKVQQQVDILKDYVALANAEYRRYLEQQAGDRARKEKQGQEEEERLKRLRDEADHLKF